MIRGKIVKKKEFGFWYILKVELTVLANGLNVEWEQNKGVNDDSKVNSNKVKLIQKNGR